MQYEINTLKHFRILCVIYIIKVWLTRAGTTLANLTYYMGIYSIKELEKLSGIKAHTIRIWEKRYGIVQPQRTTTNIRFYSDEDLKKIINVSLLNGSGIKISVIADMTDDQLLSKVIELSERNHQKEVHIDRLVTAMIDLSEDSFEQELTLLEKKFGFESTMTELVYPFLEKIGVLWQTGNITPAHEHFISNLIRQKVIVGIAALPLPKNATKRVVLFLPEHELHEIGLLFYHYVARKYGCMTYYLGQSVPHEDLKKVYEIHRPQFMITIFTSVPAPQSLNLYLSQLAEDFPMCKLLVSGMRLRMSSFHCPSNVAVFHSVEELKFELNV